MTTDQHEFHLDQIGVWGEPAQFSVTRENATAYAEATNDPIAAHLDGTYAPPVFAIVPAMMVMTDRTMSAVPDELMMKILHGEQDFIFHRPLVPGDELTCRAKVVGIHGRSTGVVVTTVLETRDAAGELVNEQYFSGFFRGGRLDGGYGETAPGHSFDEALLSRDPDWVAVQKFDEDQTFRYGPAALDPMPIHLDDDFAKMMGLPGIIIHGLCTMAFTSHAVISEVCPEDPSRLKRLAVRFSAPAQPKHTITTSVWNTGGGAYAFETVTDEGKHVIKDGLAVFAD